jgi:hypothetical protein
MMARPKDDRPTVKISCRVYDTDLERLRVYYPNTGYNLVIRRLIARHVRRLEEKYEREKVEEGSTTNGS